MKLTRPANLLPKSRVHTIFLPSSSHIHINPNDDNDAYKSKIKLWNNSNDNSNKDDLSYDRNENYLRKLDATNLNALVNKIRKVNLKEIAKKESKSKFRLNDQTESSTQSRNKTIHLKTTTATTKRHRRRNDKFLHRRPTNPEDYELFASFKDKQKLAIDYYDCTTVGWGKWMEKGDLSDVLLKIDVPIHDIKK